MQLVALFSPEHGIRGILDDDVPSSRDEQTGLPIHSLYGDTRRPTDAMLAGLDTMVIDLQDIGARFYTYMATMGYVMEEAAKRKIAVVVLDRPNPDQRLADRRPRRGRAVRRLHRVPAGDAHAPRHDDGRAGAAVQRGEEDRRGADGRARGELAARLSGSTRPASPGSTRRRTCAT